MRLVKQKICDKKKGDCFKSCVATVLQIPYSLLPNTYSKRWSSIWRKVLEKYGIEFHYDKSCWIRGYWIAVVSSKNFKGVSHSIVMKGQKVFFDPSPKKKYKIGESLLGKKTVQGGYTFIISDIEKLRKYKSLRKRG